MKFGAILTPVHQGHQQLIGSAQTGWPAKVPQVSHHYGQHLFIDSPADTGQPFKFCIL